MQKWGLKKMIVIRLSQLIIVKLGFKIPGLLTVKDGLLACHVASAFRVAKSHLLPTWPGGRYSTPCKSMAQCCTSSKIPPSYSLCLPSFPSFLEEFLQLFKMSFLSLAVYFFMYDFLVYYLELHDIKRYSGIVDLILHAFYKIHQYSNSLTLKSFSTPSQPQTLNKLCAWAPQLSTHDPPPHIDLFNFNPGVRWECITTWVNSDFIVPFSYNLLRIGTSQSKLQRLELD